MQAQADRLLQVPLSTMGRAMNALVFGRLRNWRPNSLCSNTKQAYESPEASQLFN